MNKFPQSYFAGNLFIGYFFKAVLFSVLCEKVLTKYEKRFIVYVHDKYK